MLRRACRRLISTAAVVVPPLRRILFGERPALKLSPLRLLHRMCAEESGPFEKQLFDTFLRPAQPLLAINYNLLGKRKGFLEFCAPGLCSCGGQLVAIRDAKVPELMELGR